MSAKIGLEKKARTSSVALAPQGLDPEILRIQNCKKLSKMESKKHPKMMLTAIQIPRHESTRRPVHPIVIHIVKAVPDNSPKLEDNVGGGDH